MQAPTPMKPQPLPSRYRLRLALLLLATGVLAVGGGLALLARPDGSWLGMSPEVLEPTPFTTFRIPGLVLALVVGGSQLVAGVAVARRHARGLRLATVAGVLLAGWIAIQAMMLSRVIWLQVLFFVVALVELMLVGATLPRQAPPQKKRFGAR